MSPRTCPNLPRVLHPRAWASHWASRWASHWARAPQHPASCEEAGWSQPLLLFFFLTRTRSQQPLCEDFCGRRGFPTHVRRRETNAFGLLPSGLYLCFVERKLKVYLVMAAAWFTLVLGVWVLGVFCFVVKVINCMTSSHSAFSWLLLFSVFLLVLFSFFTFSALSATFLQRKISTAKSLLTCCL